MVVARLPLGYLSEMRWLALLLALTACKSGGAAKPDDVTSTTSGLADDDVYKPSYTKAELDEALTSERASEAAAAARVQQLEDGGDYDQLRIAAADLAVRRRFIASLEACHAGGMTCPPRLDEPAWSYDVEADV